MGLADWKTKRTLIYGTGSATAIVVVLIILAFLALLGERYHWRWDVTLDKSQSLTATTKNLLGEVKEPLQMTVFYPEGQSERQEAKALLENYHYRNRLISYDFVDPERHPLVAQQAGFRYPGNVLLEYQGRKQMANNSTEEEITNAIRKLLNPEQKKIYFLTGHGERGIDDAGRNGFQTAAKALQNEGFEVLALNLVSQPQVPGDAAVVVVAGPEKPLFPHEIVALKTYLDQGGRLFILLEPFNDGGLKDFLAAYGVDLDDRMILDVNQVSQALGASVTMPMVINYGDHKITQKFTNVVTLFPLARPLTLNPSTPERIHLFTLATTMESSWAKKGQEWIKAGKVGFDAGQDQKGPFPLAVLAEIQPPGSQTGAEPPAEPTDAKEDKNVDKPQEKGQDKDKTYYLAVFGNTGFADNNYFNLSGNGDLFLNTVNFLAEQESQITVGRQEKKSQPLMLTGYQSWVLLLMSLVLIPLAMIMAGVNAYLRRRRRR
ncbi:MAG: GldG family protein [Deltaproteobacteria bacterium]|nr:GldG family protein [Deltaproteobacteria bacterium]MBW1952476.1 GldG family protein [Deltaproteobacteria bacterium]MBW1987405.1 GldG family protein [Deltaproteobacteria bacterium]MBW2135188.1 GldG family protein [Deltaproteobacteria bacterium]